MDALPGGREEPTVPKWIEWSMLALAVLMLPILVLQESATDVDVVVLAERTSGLIWLAFLGEYLYLLARARRRWPFVRRHWFDLLIIVATPPVVWVPAELEAFRALRVLRLVRALAVVGRTQHQLRKYLRRDSLPYLVILSVLVIFIGGLAITALEPERVPSIGDGIWWAAATLSTVGYGDIAPASFAGRVLAVVVMLIGIGTFAGLTAAVASYFVEHEDADEQRALRQLQSDVAQIKEQLQVLINESGRR